jgi:hypothetical protein
MNLGRALKQPTAQSLQGLAVASAVPGDHRNLHPSSLSPLRPLGAAVTRLPQVGLRGDGVPIGRAFHARLVLISRSTDSPLAHRMSRRVKPIVHLTWACSRRDCSLRRTRCSDGHFQTAVSILHLVRIIRRNCPWIISFAYIYNSLSWSLASLASSFEKSTLAITPCGRARAFNGVHRFIGLPKGVGDGLAS